MQSRVLLRHELAEVTSRLEPFAFAKDPGGKFVDLYLS